jgi:hypothetical protein
LIREEFHVRIIVGRRASGKCPACDGG